MEGSISGDLAENANGECRTHPSNFLLIVMSYPGCRRATTVGILLPSECGLDLAIQDRRKGTWRSKKGPFAIAGRMETDQKSTAKQRFCAKVQLILFSIPQSSHSLHACAGGNTIQPSAFQGFIKVGESTTL